MACFAVQGGGDRHEQTLLYLQLATWICHTNENTKRHDKLRSLLILIFDSATAC